MCGGRAVNKGKRVEREAANILRGIGFEAQRVPAGMRQDNPAVGDVKWGEPGAGMPWKAEVKSSRPQPAQIAKAMADGNDIVLWPERTLGRRRWFVSPAHVGGCVEEATRAGVLRAREFTRLRREHGSRPVPAARSDETLPLSWSKYGGEE
jgi:hypothetical protein